MMGRQARTTRHKASSRATCGVGGGGQRASAGARIGSALRCCGAGARGASRESQATFGTTRRVAQPRDRRARLYPGSTTDQVAPGTTPLKGCATKGSWFGTARIRLVVRDPAPILAGDLAAWALRSYTLPHDASAWLLSALMLGDLFVACNLGGHKRTPTSQSFDA